ncbi:MAG: hypothetical protein ACI841_004331 [Planctomycetota bacterium]|jgi:hypothetical protein
MPAIKTISSERLFDSFVYLHSIIGSPATSKIAPGPECLSPRRCFVDGMVPEPVREAGFIDIWTIRTASSPRAHPIAR